MIVSDDIFVMLLTGAKFQTLADWSFFLNEGLHGYLEHGRGKPWDKGQ
jgi:hypothetical protein